MHEDILKNLALQAAEDCFVPEFIRDDNLPERMDEGLGIAISHYCKWDGSKILRIFAAALEDANYHTEAEIIDSWLEKSG